MKALLLKDILVMKQQGKMYLLILVIYSIYSFLLKDSSMIITMIALFGFMTMFNSFSYDEKSKWNLFALSTTISRNDIVVGKYLFNLVITIGFSLLFLPVILFLAINSDVGLIESLKLIAIVSCISVVIANITLPVIFKFGIEKARIATMLIFVIPVLAPYVMQFIPSDFVIPPIIANYLPMISGILLLLFTYFSIKLSMKILKSKDL